MLPLNKTLLERKQDKKKSRGSSRSGPVENPAAEYFT